MLYADGKLWKRLAPVLLLLAAVMSCGAQERTDTPRLRLNTGGHIGAVHSLLFTADHKLISCGLDKVARVRSLDTGRISEWRYKIGDGFIGQFFAAALNPNAPHQLALGSSGAGGEDDSDILLTNYETGEQTARLKGHKGTVTGLAFAPHVNLLASCATDGKVCLWDMAAPQARPRTLAATGEYVTGVAFSPDAQWLAATSWHVEDDERFGQVRVWKLNGTRTEKPRVFGWRSDMLCLAWSKQGLLACGSSDGVIHLYDARRDFEEQTPLTVQNDSISCVAFSPDGTRLLSGGGREGHDVTARVWSLRARGASGLNVRQEFTQTQDFNKHFTTIHSVAFDPDGKYAASGDAFGAVYVWKVAKQNEETDKQAAQQTDKQTDRQGEPNAAPAESGRDARQGREGRAFFADGDEKVRAFKGMGSPVFSIAWSEAGDKVGWGNVFGRTELEHVFDLMAAVPVLNLHKETSAWRFAQSYWSDDPVHSHKSLLLQALPDASGVIVRDRQGREIRRIRLETADKLHCYGFTPDGKVIIGSELYLARYDVTGRYLRRECLFEGHEGPILALSVSPDGRYLASGGVDQTVRVWNLHSAPDSAEAAFQEKLAAGATQSATPRSEAQSEPDNGGVATSRPQTKTRAVLPLMGIFAGERGAWMAWAQNGCYTASAGGDDLLGWHINRGDKSLAEFRVSSQCQDMFYRPQVMEQLFAKGGLNQALAAIPKPNGSAPGNASIQEQITRVPQLTNVRVEAEHAPLLPDANGAYTTSSDKVTIYCSFEGAGGRLNVNAELNRAQGARPWPIRENGIRPSTEDTSGARGWGRCVYDPQKREWKISIAGLVTGRPNEIGIFAINDSGRSDFRALQITCAKSEADPEKLRVFSVGISSYGEAKYNLRYAESDARAINAFFKDNATPLFADVSLHSLSNQAATRAAIEAGLEQLSHEVQPQDTLLLFFACHGFTLPGSNEFYLAPADTDFSRASPRNGVAWSAILQSLTRIRARHIVLIVDHCFAGGINDTLLQTAVGQRAQAQDQAMRGLYDNNLLVFSAAGSDEFSYEDSTLKHGVFTQAVLNALEGGMEPSLYPQGNVMLDALGYWVPREVARLNSEAARLNSGANRSQHPRLFALPNADDQVPLAKAKQSEKK